MKFATRLSLFLCASSAIGMASTAFAWDPNEGTDAGPSPFKAHSAGGSIHNDIYVPADSAAPGYSAPVYTPQPAYTPAPAAAPAPSSSLPAAYYPGGAVAVPAYAPAPAYDAAPAQLPPPPVFVPAAGEAAYGNQPVATQQTRGPNRHSLGIEGFYDHYKEPDNADYKGNALYGAIDGSATHYLQNGLFGTVEGRASYGEAHDKNNDDGSIHNVPQWEFEGRLLAGYDKLLANGAHLKPYMGFGARYYRDNEKGKTSTDGAPNIDSTTIQLYVPFGLTYEFTTASGFTIAPNLELDPMLGGYVQNRYTNIGGPDEGANRQTQGTGARGQIMFSKLDDAGRGWEFGPFIRYWNIAESKADDTFGGIRIPKNTNVETGAKLNYLF